MTKDSSSIASAENPKIANKILVVVDTQVDFVMSDGNLPVHGAERILRPGIDLLTKLDSAEYAAVLFTFDTHSPEEYLGSLENLGNAEQGVPGFPLHCDKGTPGWENVFNPNLVPEAIPVYQLEKTVFDMWEKPGEETLVYQIPRNRPGSSFPTIGRDRDSFFDHMLPESVDTVDIVGVASDFCVKDAIAGFLRRGMKVRVHREITAGILRDIDQTVATEFPGTVQVI